MKTIHLIAFTLLIIGGLNWGLSALGYNVVNMILGSWPMVEKLVYILVGLSAIEEALMHKKLCRNCNPGGGAPTSSMSM